jgi:hypothetical protein
VSTPRCCLLATFLARLVRAHEHLPRPNRLVFTFPAYHLCMAPPPRRTHAEIDICRTH